MVELHKNNCFSKATIIGRGKKPQMNYEFAAGFSETTGKDDRKSKIDQRSFQPDQNLNYLQTTEDDTI